MLCKMFYVLATLCSYTNWKLYIAYNFPGPTENDGFLKFTVRNPQFSVWP